MKDRKLLKEAKECERPACANSAPLSPPAYMLQTALIWSPLSIAGPRALVCSFSQADREEPPPKRLGRINWDCCRRWIPFNWRDASKNTSWSHVWSKRLWTVIYCTEVADIGWWWMSNTGLLGPRGFSLVCVVSLILTWSSQTQRSSSSYWSAWSKIRWARY